MTDKNVCSAGGSISGGGERAIFDGVALLGGLGVLTRVVEFDGEQGGHRFGVAEDEVGVSSGGRLILCIQLMRPPGPLPYGTAYILDGRAEVLYSADLFPGAAGMIPDAVFAVADGAVTIPYAAGRVPNGCAAIPNGSGRIPNGDFLIPNGFLWVPNGGVLIPNGFS